MHGRVPFGCSAMGNDYRSSNVHGVPYHPYCVMLEIHELAEVVVPRALLQEIHEQVGRFGASPELAGAGRPQRSENLDW